MIQWKLGSRKQKRKTQLFAKPGIEHCHWFILLLLATPTMQLSLDRKAWFSYVGKIPDCLGWTGTNLENRERFYFSDASQISAMVADHSRHMNSNLYLRGYRHPSAMDFAHYQRPKLLNSSPPITNNRENLRPTSGEYPIYRQNLGWSTKKKSPIV